MVAGTPTTFVPLLAYQKAAVESPARFRWSCWARQTGKSFAMSLRRILRGLQRRRDQIFLSASERQSRELILKARQHCQALQVSAREVGSQWFNASSYGQTLIELPNGVRIIGMPANPETVRGFTGDVFLDEFAMHADDRAIWAATFPTLLRGDGELDVASTPKGMSNLFYELSRNERFERTTVTLPQAIEQGLKVDPAGIQRSMADDELYRQEFLCEFLDEATAFLTYAQIAACEDAALNVGVPSIGTDGALFAGMDIGRKRDLTVLWVVERAGDAYVTRDVHVRRNEPFAEQYELLRGVLSARRLRRVCIDAGGLGMQLAESATKEFGVSRVQAVTFTAGLKSQLAHRLRIVVEQRRIRIPVDERIRNDWHSVRRTVGSGGRMKFDAARGGDGHGDRFWAAALALHAADQAPGAAECTTVGPLAFARGGAW